jgi:hypothetical protein
VKAEGNAREQRVTVTNGTGTLTLEEWINEVGVKAVAKLLRVNESAVRHWRRGFCLPKTEQMDLIRKYSKGRVSCDEMIAQFHRKA